MPRISASVDGQLWISWGDIPGWGRIVGVGLTLDEVIQALEFSEGSSTSELVGARDTRCIISDGRFSVTVHGVSASGDLAFFKRLLSIPVLTVSAVDLSDDSPSRVRVVEFFPGGRIRVLPKIGEHYLETGIDLGLLRQAAQPGGAYYIVEEGQDIVTLVGDKSLGLFSIHFSGHEPVHLPAAAIVLEGVTIAVSG